MRALPFHDLDERVPPLVAFPADPWVDALRDAKNEFEVYGATFVYSTWRVEREAPLPGAAWS